MNAKEAIEHIRRCADGKDLYYAPRIDAALAILTAAVEERDRILAASEANHLAKVKADRDYWEREQANENGRWRQAEAELADLKKKYEGAKALLFGEKAELDKWKPLIDAVEKTDEKIIRAGVGLHTIGMCRPILEAALKCREGEK